MIKTVLFDLGNVILPFDLSRLAGRLAPYSTRTLEEIIELLWSDEIAHSFETGLMSPQEYFIHVSKACEFDGLTFEKFVPIFNEIFVEDAEVAALIRGLKKNHKLGLISNTNAIHVPYVMQTYDVLRQFDRLWFSNIERVRKPDPAIYEMALKHFDIAPEEAVFIDDLPANIEGARKVGINGVLFQGAAGLKQELSKLGVTY